MPGLLMAAAMMVVVRDHRAAAQLAARGPGARARAAAHPFRGALPLSMPIVLLGGIYGGVFTPTEAAAVAALHALLLAGVVYRALTWRALFGVLLESARVRAR